MGEIRLDDLPPDLADQIRDALALVKCAMDCDELGARVIIGALEDEGGRALEAVTRVMARMYGMTLREMGIRPEQFTGFTSHEDEAGP